MTWSGPVTVAPVTVRLPRVVVPVTFKVPPTLALPVVVRLATVEEAAFNAPRVEVPAVRVDRVVAPVTPSAPVTVAPPVTPSVVLVALTADKDDSVVAPVTPSVPPTVVLPERVDAPVTPSVPPTVVLAPFTVRLPCNCVFGNTKTLLPTLCPIRTSLSDTENASEPGPTGP